MRLIEKFFKIFSNLEFELDGGQIMNSNNLPIDANGIPFAKSAFWLDSIEYGKICSEINQIYDVQYKDKRIATHISFGVDGKAYVYWFENHGFDNYNIFLRVIDNH